MYIKKFKSNFLTSLQLDLSKKNENTIIGSDICCSCFSNSGLDVIKLLKSNSKISTKIVYTLFEKDIIKFYKNYTGLKSLPLSDMGLSLTIKNPKEIYQVLKKLILICI